MLNEYNKKEAAKTRWGMQRVNLLRNLLKYAGDRSALATTTAIVVVVAYF